MDVQSYSIGFGHDTHGLPGDLARAGRSRREGAKFSLTRPERKNEDLPTFSQQEKPEPVRVGFGSGSVSVPGMTIAALKRNLREAQELVPTIVESEDRVRERIAADKERLEGISDPEPPRFLDVRIGAEEAAGQARTFINRVNSTAGQALAHVGLGGSQATEGPSARIGDAQLRLNREPSAPRFDMFA